MLQSSGLDYCNVLLIVSLEIDPEPLWAGKPIYKKIQPCPCSCSNFNPLVLGQQLCTPCPCLAVARSWTWLSLPGLSQTQAEGKSFLSSVVELPARAPCWLPLRQAASPVYFSWPIHDCFMGSLPLFLHLLPFCFSLSSN